MVPPKQFVTTDDDDDDGMPYLILILFSEREKIGIIRGTR